MVFIVDTEELHQVMEFKRCAAASGAGKTQAPNHAELRAEMNCQLAYSGAMRNVGLLQRLVMDFIYMGPRKRMLAAFKLKNDSNKWRAMTEDIFARCKQLDLLVPTRENVPVEERNEYHAAVIASEFVRNHGAEAYWKLTTNETSSVAASIWLKQLARISVNDSFWDKQRKNYEKEKDRTRKLLETDTELEEEPGSDREDETDSESSEDSETGLEPLLISKKRKLTQEVISDEVILESV